MLQEILSLHVVSVSSPSSQPMHCGQNKKRLEFLFCYYILTVQFQEKTIPIASVRPIYPGWFWRCRCMYATIEYVSKNIALLKGISLQQLWNLFGWHSVCFIDLTYCQQNVEMLFVVITFMLKIWGGEGNGVIFCIILWDHLSSSNSFWIY